MDDLKEKIYLLALDMIGDKKATFICDALSKSYKEYTGTEEPLSDEELEELFSEFFNLYDNKYWYQPKGESIDSIVRHRIRGCWWSRELKEPREKILELILNRGCR